MLNLFFQENTKNVLQKSSNVFKIFTWKFIFHSPVPELHASSRVIQGLAPDKYMPFSAPFGSSSEVSHIFFVEGPICKNKKAKTE